MIRSGLKALAAAGACAAGFNVYIWMSDTAAHDARRHALAVDSDTVVSEIPIRSIALADEAGPPTADERLSAALDAWPELMSATATFTDRFALDRSTRPSMSFADRFGGDGLTGAVRSAASAERTTVAAAPRTAARTAAMPKPRPGGFQLASASDTPVALAYAPADTGVKSGLTGPLKDLTPDDADQLADLDPSHTAIYDITSRTVYLPNGRRLEAHSGLGDYMDDPGSVGMKNVGVTPPNAYKLKMRESLFHGVRALRLVPKNDSKMYGRAGILAHTYMLGPNGQSNGCVSFKDYAAFLDAYERGDITHLVVVERLAGDPPSPKTAADWISNTLKSIFQRS